MRPSPSAIACALFLSAAGGFAQKTLPTLKEHKRMADELHASKGGGSASAAKHDHDASGSDQ